MYYYYYVLFVIISIAFYSMNQQTRILFSNNSTLFSSRCHFSFQCETSACTFVCQPCRGPYVYGATNSSSSTNSSYIPSSATQTSLTTIFMTLQLSAHYFLGRSFRKLWRGGSEIQRNSSSNNRIVFLYLSLRSQKYSCRDRFVSFERKIFYNLYSISFENFLTRATLMKRNFLNFKNSLSSFV